MFSRLTRSLLCSLLFTASIAAQEPKSTWHPDEERLKPDGGGVFCPPAKGKPHKKIAKDQDINFDDKIDFYLGEFRWDDGKGNDARLELWCINDEHFSVRLYQSKKGAETLVATPGGKDKEGRVYPDPGKC